MTERLRLVDALHSTITTPNGTFKIHHCERDDHIGCLMLTGREFDPDDDSDHGVHFHADMGYVISRLENGEWERELPDEKLSRVHGDDGVGPSPGVTS